jgi:aminoglycoside phosphotransferase (APT) family kinase protein
MPWRDRLEGYLHSQLPSASSVEITRVLGMPAGASNETAGLDVRVECDGHAFNTPLVLRPQRRDGILAPYDVGRQFRVMRALATTPVPVPTVAWLCEDEDVLGTPFFFMSRLEGETLPVLWYGGPPGRLAAIAGALASVHAVDWRGAGLGFLDPGAGLSPVGGEVADWLARYGRVGLAENRVVVALRDFLIRSEPADTRFAMLHGDPNPGNYLIDGERVVAVLDWELAAVGDPRSDLGFYAALASVFGGMPSDRGRTAYSSAYAAITGRSPADLEFFEALGLFKMGVVLAGWQGAWGAGYGLELISRRLEALFGPRWAA